MPACAMRFDNDVSARRCVAPLSEASTLARSIDFIATIDADWRCRANHTTPCAPRPISPKRSNASLLSTLVRMAANRAMLLSRSDSRSLERDSRAARDRAGTGREVAGCRLLPPPMPFHRGAVEWPACRRPSPPLTPTPPPSPAPPPLARSTTFSSRSSSRSGAPPAPNSYDATFSSTRVATSGNSTRSLRNLDAVRHTHRNSPTARTVAVGRPLTLTAATSPKISAWRRRHTSRTPGLLPPPLLPPAPPLLLHCLSQVALPCEMPPAACSVPVSCPPDVEG
mmetsp:Transcript_6584/g.19852  ORF Transcript_6584/g.19852 Transcript_6584/m.19852 type:complete len:282 (-) Transcript_6584:1460-2305(-)